MGKTEKKHFIKHLIRKKGIGHNKRKDESKLDEIKCLINIHKDYEEDTDKHLVLWTCPNCETVRVEMYFMKPHCRVCN